MATYNTTAAIDAMLRANSAPVEAEMQAAKNNYDAAVKRLEAQRAAEDAQAYRSFERQKRELPQVMAANGAQGGMVDSAIASMQNNYMNNRNARALQMQDDLAEHQLNYDNNMLQLRAKLAAYQQQAAADKAEAQYRRLKGSGGGDLSDAPVVANGTANETMTNLLKKAKTDEQNARLDLMQNLGRGGYYDMGSMGGAGSYNGTLTQFRNTNAPMKN
ncbi:MAG: hypothetical protein IJC61_01980 [Oscillospiraceae bacterium]|nr:hypothetical protein [Oscillospiraceae bacterium]